MGIYTGVVLSFTQFKYTMYIHSHLNFYQYKRKTIQNQKNIYLYIITCLITDSKGDCVKRVSPSIGRFEIISKKGTNFADNDFIHSVAEKIKEDNKPIILFWFGTCQLTAKKGKYIYIRQPPYQNIERCLTEAREAKEKRANKEAKIIFLDCPYYSTIKYNNKTSNRTVHPIRGNLKLTAINNKTISVNDLKLNKAVDYYNSQLLLLNNVVTPKFGIDILAPTKRAIYKVTKYRKNFNLYYDGVHPIRPLSKLWLYRILNFANTLQD